MNKQIFSKTLMCVLFVSFMAASNVFALTVEQAYEAIPHRRTVFNAKEAKMSQAEKKYLVEFYRLVDLAIVQRVDMLTFLRSQGRKGKAAQDYDMILRKLRDLNAPEKLFKAHELVISAIEDQRSFLKVWKRKGFKANVNVTSDPKVKSANTKLLGAYSIFMRSYPDESEHNKQAFFDYLCALDFI